MTKQEIQKRIEELQSQIDELRRATKEVVGNPFERDGGHCYCVSDYGAVVETADVLQNEDSWRYAVANYCHDQDLMKKRAAEETLSRLIWREAENANAKLKGKQDCGLQYTIYYSSRCKNFSIMSTSRAYIPGIKAFLSGHDANVCIKNIVIPFVKNHPELGWELEEEEN